MTALWDTIADLVRARAAEVGESTLVRERHRAALARALRALQSARRVSRETPELVAEELRVATTELGRITGAINVEDVLGDIFSSFCIGK